jgi:hypothetical protein
MVVFDEAAFRELAPSAANDRQLAAKLGVHERTYIRLKMRDIEPGEDVLRGFLANFPNVDPRTVFRYDAEATRRERAA